MGDLLDAFDRTAKSGRVVKGEDDALVAAGRTIAAQIDWAVEYGEGQEVTKALYLTPHLMNILKEMLATPAARSAGKKPESKGGKLASVSSVPRPKAG